MPWNTIGSIIVGTQWQYTGIYPTQLSNVIRLTPLTTTNPGFPCVITLRRDNGLWHWCTQGIFVEPSIPQVVRFPDFPTGLVAFNLQVGMKLSRVTPRSFGVTLAYWTN